MQELGPLLPLIGIALLFWFLIIRPQSKQRKTVMTMQANLEAGDEVMLTSGVYGTVARLQDDTAWVVVADGVTLKVARGAIGQVVAPERTGAGDVDPETGSSSQDG